MSGIEATFYKVLLLKSFQREDSRLCGNEVVGAHKRTEWSRNLEARQNQIRWTFFNNVSIFLDIFSNDDDDDILMLAFGGISMSRFLSLDFFQKNHVVLVMTTRNKLINPLCKILILKSHELIFRKDVKRNKVLNINLTSHMKLMAKMWQKKTELERI